MEQEKKDLDLFQKEKIFCLKDIRKKIVRCLYVYEQDLMDKDDYDYKKYLENIILYVRSSDHLFDGMLVNVIVYLNILKENDFEKDQFKKIIFECKNYVDFLIKGGV